MTETAIIQKKIETIVPQVAEENEQIEDTLEKLVSEEIRNKTTFHLNQISQNNISEKSVEISNYLGNHGFIRWFSRVLVQRRAALENSMQLNYVNLLKAINQRNLYSHVTKESYLFLRHLLNNQNEKQNDKNVMKNIGTFIGQITLARNKPIIIKYLNVKNLLTDAFKH